ncbi:MAG: hypothetical protein AB7C90_04190 [Bacteroidales bacterium]
MRAFGLSLLFAITFAFSVEGSLKGQEADSEPFDALEEMAELPELSEGQVEEFSEHLERLRRNPATLNRASAAMVAELLFLDPLLANNLANYIRRYGAPVNPAELASVEGFSEELVNRLLPYISFHPARIENWRASIRQADGYLRGTFRYQYPLEKGYSPQAKSPFSGTPLQQRIRGEVRFPAKAEIGFSAEKDAGEPFTFENTVLPYDYLSGYLLLEKPLKRWLPQLSQLLAGDFKIHSGYGVIFGQGFGFRKAGFVADGAKPGRGVTPHTGFNETDYLRGLALRIDQGRWRIEAFGSHRKRDAVLEQNPLEEKRLLIRSFPSTGLHRTPTERLRKNSVDEAALGFSASYSAAIIDGGIAYSHLQYKYPVVSKASYFAAGVLRGARHENYAISLRIKGAKVQLFGEWAGYNSMGKALYTGIQTRPGGGVTAEISYRNYNRWYAAPLGRGFGHASNNANEEGLFLHLSKQLARGLAVTGYADWYKSALPKYRANRPTQGWQLGFRGEQKSRGETVISVDYRIRMKQENGPVQGSNKVLPQPRILHRLKYSGRFYPSTALVLKTEITGALLAEPTGTKRGVLLSGAIRYTGNQLPVKAEIWALRVNSRKGMEPLYVMQRSAINPFSSTPCTGRGTQVGIWFEWRPCSRIIIRQKSSCWLYDTLRSGGSGSTSWQGWRKTAFELSVSLGNSS